jgi:hypothetical protein
MRVVAQTVKEYFPNAAGLATAATAGYAGSATKI